VAKSIWDRIHVLDKPTKEGFKYVTLDRFEYFSRRYGKMISALPGEKFDGATGAIDIDSESWVIHDVLCRDGVFDDGTPCNNWQASMILGDVLADEGRWFRRLTWPVATWLGGGGKARDNGLF